MKQQILKDKEFFIISRSIDNASRCKVIELCEDCFKVKLENPNKFEVSETVELFAMTQKGQLYFETIVKDVQEDVISIWVPITHKYLQRREFTRINSDDSISLQYGNNEYEAKIIDISAGGLKVETRNQLELQKDYQTKIQIDKKFINCIFEPIRIEALQNSFISSGRFKEMQNIDRIILVQYCFRKQIEISNK